MKSVKKNKISLLRKNRGFAILFALGILSVILVIVMLFATKAKVASNISSIHMENQSARTLAKSLVPRIILTINNSTGVQDQILFSSIHDEGNTDLCKDYVDAGLYTYDWIWKLEHPAHIRFTPTITSNKGELVENGTFRFYQTKNKNTAPTFDETNPYVPTWQYILDIPSPEDEDEVDGKLPKQKRGVVARFAYVIVPKIAHLDPNAIASHTHCTKLSEASTALISHESCTKCARKLGNSPAELMFGPPKGVSLKDGDDIRNTAEGYKTNNKVTTVGFQQNNYKKWANIQDFCVTYGITVPGLDAPDDEIDKYIADKDTVTRFMEIDNVGDREAFWSDDGDPDDDDKGQGDGIRDPVEFYHRFNMRRTDWNDLTISDIKKAPKKWSDLGNKEPSETGSNNHDTGGIAWLANWEDKGDWNNAEDTQNQVIANLLNFCSDASRPVVSDVDPQNWKTNDPKYTGLKRTLYINEVFYDLTLRSEATVSHDSAADETTIEASYQFDSEFIVELVDMYLNTLGDKNNNPVKFKEDMLEADFSAYRPEVYGTLTYQIVNPKTGAWETKTRTIEGDLNGDDFKRFEDDSDKDQISGAQKKYGYYGYTAYFDEKFAFDAYKESGNVSEQEVLDKMKVRNVRLNIKKILLYRIPTDDEKKFLSGNNNAEYKTFPKGLTEKDSAGNPKEYVDCALVNLTHNNMPQTVVGSEDGKTLLALCGDREAIDPRQNLRAGDWATTKTKAYKTEADYANKHQLWSLPIQTFTVAGGMEVPDNIIPTNDSLKTNSPKLDKTGGTNTQDYEVTDDPSWKLASGIKVEPTKFDSHISTAFIRHAVLRKQSGSGDALVEYPMESLWELGAIHRGSRWQTLNLSKSPTYTTAEEFVKDGAGDYEEGDAPILDQVKMTNDCISYGKVNLVRHVDTEVRDTVIGSLFLDMPVHKTGFYISQGLNDSGLEDTKLFPNIVTAQVRIHDEDDPDHGLSDVSVKAQDEAQWYHTSYVAALYDTLYGDFGNQDPLKRDLNDSTHKNKFWRRTDFLSAPKKVGSHQSQSSDFSDMLFPIRQNYGTTTDAMEEQIIGRTINLMKIDSTVKGATAILIVQTLKDAAKLAPTGGSLDTKVFRDWNSDGIINQSKELPDSEKESMIGQHQAGYRRFSDLDESEPGFFMPPPLHSEAITSKLGSYENGADTITGETKVVITLDFDTATQKWKMVKYEYAD